MKRQDAERVAWAIGHFQDEAYIRGLMRGLSGQRLEDFAHNYRNMIGNGKFLSSKSRRKMRRTK